METRLQRKTSNWGWPKYSGVLMLHDRPTLGSRTRYYSSSSSGSSKLLKLLLDSLLEPCSPLADEINLEGQIDRVYSAAAAPAAPCCIREASPTSEGYICIEGKLGWASQASDLTPRWVQDPPATSPRGAQRQRTPSELCYRYNGRI
ncbi:hypothetical protein CRG98_032318 [Punica granatum]|uniref:Uncharacterized protein n=1 Tax=Punica granatum TaxID=22663 RepID=A0A2I0ITG0_PUNGR|nr:hypothetical protein CRG98_032318 [Punica granatum]